MNATETHIAEKRSISLAPVSILNGHASASASSAPLPSRLKEFNHTKNAAVIVFGRDEAGRAHASWFDEAERPLAEAAADFMGFAALGVGSDAVRGLAAHLPRGKVFASGRAFVPFVKASLYERLAAHLPNGIAGATRVAIEATATNAPESASSAADEATVNPDKPNESRDWGTLKKGDIVLASEAPGEPWYPATIMDERPNGLLKLRWRDYEDEPAVFRKREHIGLLHPNCPV